MYIVQVASEVAPMAKVGGLSDVMMGLSRELTSQGHAVDIIVPKYDCLDLRGQRMECVKTPVRSYFEGTWHENSLWKAPLSEDVDVTFIESHHPRLFFERGCIYGCHDDIDRFLYFSRAVLDLLAKSDKIPDIIHIHDWMTASIAFLIRQDGFQRLFEKTRTVLTIHNMAYQGRCAVSDLDKIGVQGSWFEAPHRMQEDFGSQLNLLKGGIVFSDYTTTVSDTYAKEVLTPEGGMGLQLTLQKNLNKFSGILNGLDYVYWDPETDSSIQQNYKISTLADKEKNKEAIRAQLGLAQDESKPLVVVITRLVQQKGVDLIRHALHNAHKKSMQMIVLGTAPDPALHWEFNALAMQLEKDPDVRILLEQEEMLAHKLYAAADIILVPSRFEPCGLTQLIALRYGTIPIVRKTGGLADTVFDVDFSGRTFENTNGFSFDHADPQGLESALDRALSLYRNNRERWNALKVQGMQCDFSWKISASRYAEIYDRILQKDAQKIEG